MERKAFVATFPVRYYECDSYQHVNHANYARYMSEAAFQASSMAGYAAEKMENLGQAWLAREHQIEFLAPIRFGDELQVHTWVADFRRVRSLRRYEFYVDGALKARATTDWVYVDVVSQRPLTPPDEMIAAFEDKNGSIEAAPTRERFPKPPPHPVRPFIYLQPVEWRDIDPQQHLNNAAYLTYLENSTFAMCDAFGWPLSRMRAANFGIVARHYRIEFKGQARMGDTLKVTTWVSEKKRASAIRHYTVERAADGELLAQARVLWVWVDLATQRPIRIPPDFYAAFRDNFYEA